MLEGHTTHALSVASPDTSLGISQENSIETHAIVGEDSIEMMSVYFGER
jgi:hypothetical protein